MFWDQKNSFPVEAINYSEIQGSFWNLNILQGSGWGFFPWVGSEEMHNFIILWASNTFHCEV